MDFLNKIQTLIDTKQIYINMPLQEFFDLLGTPDQIGNTTRKYKIPSLFKYQNIEFAFTPAKYKSQPQFLWYVMEENHNFLLRSK